MKPFEEWSRDFKLDHDEPEYMEEIEFIEVNANTFVSSELIDGVVECCCCHNYFLADYEFDKDDESLDHYCGGSPRCCP